MNRISPRKNRPIERRNRTLSGMAILSLLAALIVAVPYALTANDKKDKNKSAETSKTLKGLPIDGLSDDEAILLALDRLGFGPRPGDLDRIKELGLQKWVDQQLHPESIDDSAAEAKLDHFPTLKMSSAKLLEEFPQPQVAARREGVTVEEYRKEQQEKMRSAMQSMQPDNDIADAQGMPNFEAGNMDPNADPSKAKGEGKGQGSIWQSDV